MKTIFLDFETYWDQQYSLKNMTPVEYILDPRFEVQLLTVKEGLHGVPYAIDGPDVGEFFAQLPAEVIIVTHNALFDMCICAWVYGYVPKLMVDTLSIARARLAAFLRSLSLASVSKHLGLGVKGNALINTRGMTFAQIKANPVLYHNFVEYGLHDVDLCAGIYRVLVVEGRFPPQELVVQDMVLRCAVQPQFVLDEAALAEHLFVIQQEKEQMLSRAMLAGVNSKEDLMSNDKFAQVLRNLGVDPPMKISPTTGKAAYAFAKTDQGFNDLREHENIAVQVVVEARFGHKSTIEETRTERFLAISRLQWHDNAITPGGNSRLMPMPLRNSGAHTHRLSGDWSLNVQNLQRGTKTKPPRLRRALTARDGHVVVAADSAQIEARMVSFLSGCTSLTTAFEEGRDVYSEFATVVFGFPVSKVNIPERFIGKQSILGLGYGLGHEKFTRTIPILSLNQIGQQIDLADEEGLRIVQTYRKTYPEIPRTWKVLNNLIALCLAGGKELQWGPVLFKRGEIVLPSGLSLYYHDLYQADGQWLFTFGGKIKGLWGGTLLENISQALARIVIMDAAVRVRRRLDKYGIRLALQVHDELVYVPPGPAGELVKRVVMEEMSRRPTWGQGLPLATEGGIGPNYGEAK
jgi:DNA polymerase